MSKDVIWYILFMIAIILLNLFIIELLVYIVCWAFGFTFSYKLGIGIFIILFTLKHIFNKEEGDY